MPCTAYGHQCVFVASSEAVDIQRSQRTFSSITQVVLMSETGGISENLDAGLRKEDSQEDGMPVSTQPNSRVSVDGDPDVMTLLRESCVLKPIGSGNRLRKRKPVDVMVEDHVVDTNGNVGLETSSSTPAVTFRRKRIKLKTPAETETQSRPRPTKSSSSTRTKNQDLASQINELKDSLATLTSAVSNFASGPGVRPGLGYDSFNTDSGLDLGPAPGGAQSGVNPLMPKVGGFPDYQDQYIDHVAHGYHQRMVGCQGQFLVGANIGLQVCQALHLRVTHVVSLFLVPWSMLMFILTLILT